MRWLVILTALFAFNTVSAADLNIAVTLFCRSQLFFEAFQLVDIGFVVLFKIFHACLSRIGHKQGTFHINHGNVQISS